MTTMRWIVAVVAVIGLSCGGNGGSTGGGVDVGADVGDADPDTPEAPDTSVEPAPFAVSVQVDRTVGVPGQEFALEATGIDIDTAELTFAWSDGADGPTRTVQFDAPGEYAVGVTATDAAGAEVETGVFLLVFEPGPHFVGDLDDDGTVDLQDRALLAGFLAGTEDLDTETWRRADLDGDLRVDGIDLAWLDDALSASAPAPTRLDPANGSRGTVVSVVHPVLLDPAVTVTIQVGDADPLVPARGLPGRAAFAVPPGLTRPGATEVKILVDGAEAASLPFEILAPPPVGQTPGVRILETHAALDTALEALPELIDEIGAFTELSEEDRGILRGTLLASGDALRPATCNTRRFWACSTPRPAR